MMSPFDKLLQRIRRRPPIQVNATTAQIMHGHDHFRGTSPQQQDRRRTLRDGAIDEPLLNLATARLKYDAQRALFQPSIAL